MTKDCNTCIHKEGSCYPSTTIFDKDKTCKSYDPDYEGYIADLEKENAELKAKNKWYSEQVCNKECAEVWGNLTKAKEIIKNLLILKNDHFGNTKMEWRVEVTEQAEQFLKDLEK